MSLILLAGCGDSSAPHGIVTLAPHLTETVFALGKGGDVVAVGKFDDFPARVRSLPDVGGYLDPDLEAISLFNPALLIVPGAHRKVSEYAEANGITVLNVHMDSMETIYQGIATIGNTLGAVRDAEALCQRIREAENALKIAMGDTPPKRTLIITSREKGSLDNLFTVGGNSFVSEMVALGGGENIFGNEDKSYFEASKESLVAAAPEAIIEFHAGKSMTQNQEQAFYDDWQALPDLPAVQSGQIIFIKASHALRPGPRVVDIARIVVRSLHPNVHLPDQNNS